VLASKLVLSVDSKLIELIAENVFQVWFNVVRFGGEEGAPSPGVPMIPLCAQLRIVFAAVTFRGTGTITHANCSSSPSAAVAYTGTNACNVDGVVARSKVVARAYL